MVFKKQTKKLFYCIYYLKGSKYTIDGITVEKRIITKEWLSKRSSSLIELQLEIYKKQ